MKSFFAKPFEQTKHEDFFTHLPNEMLRHILSHLSPRDIDSLARTRRDLGFTINKELGKEEIIIKTKLIKALSIKFDAKDQANAKIIINQIKNTNLKNLIEVKSLEKVVTRYLVQAEADPNGNGRKAFIAACNKVQLKLIDIQTTEQIADSMTKNKVAPSRKI